MEKMLYIHNKYVLQKDYLNAQEIKEDNLKIKRCMKAADYKANLEEQKLLARGICPKCHMILPYSGQCDCGYHK